MESEAMNRPDPFETRPMVSPITDVSGVDFAGQREQPPASLDRR